MSNKLLFGGFFTSLAYLSYKVYGKVIPSNPESEENYWIFKKMDEHFHGGHLKNTPFPAYLEIKRNLTQNESITVPMSLCQSIQMQFQRDWNSLMYKMSKSLLK